MLLQANPVLAGSDDILHREIKGGIAESRELRDTQIKVHVEERLVVLADHPVSSAGRHLLLTCQLQALIFHGGHWAG
jgi:hypothetical protein